MTLVHLCPPECGPRNQLGDLIGRIGEGAYRGPGLMGQSVVQQQLVRSERTAMDQGRCQDHDRRSYDPSHAEYVEKLAVHGDPIVLMRWRYLRCGISPEHGCYGPALHSLTLLVVDQPGPSPGGPQSSRRSTRLRRPAVHNP